MTRIKTSQHGFLFNPCNLCNPWLKILAKMSDSNELQFKEERKSLVFLRLLRLFAAESSAWRWSASRGLGSKHATSAEAHRALLAPNSASKLDAPPYASRRIGPGAMQLAPAYGVQGLRMHWQVALCAPRFPAVFLCVFALTLV
jgi:hypothetical protein